MTTQQPQTKMTIAECRELLTTVDSRIYDIVTPSMVRGLAQRMIDRETTHMSLLEDIVESGKAFAKIVEQAEEAQRGIDEVRKELADLRANLITTATRECVSV